MKKFTYEYISNQSIQQLPSVLIPTKTEREQKDGWWIYREYIIYIVSKCTCKLQLLHAIAMFNYMVKQCNWIQCIHDNFRLCSPFFEYHMQKITKNIVSSATWWVFSSKLWTVSVFVLHDRVAATYFGNIEFRSVIDGVLASSCLKLGNFPETFHWTRPSIVSAYGPATHNNSNH